MSQKSVSNSDIRFYTPLPYYLDYHKKRYTLTPAFDNVLNLYEAVDGSSPYEQIDLIAYYLFKKKVPRDPGLIQACIALLFPAQKKRQEIKAYDPIQDSALVYAAFRQAYQIDLHQELGKMHWWEFSALLQGLPADTRLSEIIQIRLKPIPRATQYNSEEIAQLIKLKNEYSLKISEEEREERLQAGYAQIAQTLLAIAKRGDALSQMEKLK